MLAMGLGSLLAPLWWLWYATVYLYSHSWVLAASVAVVSSTYLFYVRRLALADSSWRAAGASRAKVAKVVTKHSTLGQEIKQVLPVHPHNGWSLCSVSHGLRLFSRFFPSLGVADTPCLAATTIISVSPKKLLSIATNGRDIPCWLEGVSMAPQYIQQPRGTTPSDGDVVQLSFRLRRPESLVGVAERSLGQLRRWGTHFTQKYAAFLDGVFTIPSQFHTETFERGWGIDGEGCGQVCWVARQPSQLPYHWSMMVLSGSVKDKGQTIATLVMLPKSPCVQPLTSDLLTSQLAALKDFSCLRRAKAYPHTSSVTHIPAPRSTRPLLPPQSQGRVPAPSVAVPSKPPSSSAGDDPLVLVPNSPLPTSLPTPHPAASSRQQLNSQTSTASNSSTLTSSPLTMATPPGSPLASRYERLGRESCDRLVSVAEATEEDGWTPIGTNKDVFVMKKPPQKGEASVNCVKGTGMVRAPPDFVYRILRDGNAGKFDDMLKEVRLVDKVSDNISLSHLLYKSVWPTTPRDFTTIVTTGRYDEATIVEAAVSVVDPRLPEEKGYVRGNVVCGGYVIKSVAEQPEMCEVTYVSQAELKGNIPSFAANKVTESQPMCVAALRVLAEESYAELRSDPQRMRELEERVVVGWVKPSLTLPTSRPLTSPREGENPADSGTNGDVREGEGNSHSDVSNEREMTGDSSLPLTNGSGTNEKVESWTVVTPPPVSTETGRGRGDGMLVMEALRTYTPDEITSEEEEEEGQAVGGEGEEERDGGEGARNNVQRIRFEKKLQPYPLTPNSRAVPADSESLTEESISFPRQESGGVDFRTLGNQTAARVLEELFHVSSLDIENPYLFNDGANGWKVIDVEKEVVILRKKSPGNPFFSFMGRGVIELPPRKVYDSIRNPQLRFAYDNMLKELHFVQHVEDGLYILHVHHETTQCFIKQSRDFCVLANEREEGNQLLLVGLSVDIPECPVNPNITRAKVAFSGWVIEPCMIHRREASLVTYLLQVDLGGVPATLVNHVSKRQPLAIAYLRDYLVSTQPN